MKYILLIIQVGILYLFYFVGNLVQELLTIPIPGSIIGMLLLFLLLSTGLMKEKWLASGSQFLITYLSLLFVPATVGLIDYLPIFKGKGIITVVITLVSTYLVMFVSGIIGQVIAKGKEHKQQKGFEGGFGA
ncbi:CidA/LrgA family protein [Ferdinandcohnia quinoae]|uniref:CidA/LrgA family holin-like protein n=1 Tax=Fredinandcohnia quinoae TaxID=2918902 RepID=A0AAW5E5M9_9BACI|nr:CidA/LrgA family holin-like protein [Fredinandcohnia sp. SECRCQ15]MCH1625362.1 CidA/LrgA family holin-like protein [Fredinandcohnia sp. SECRCQ15]